MLPVYSFFYAANHTGAGKSFPAPTRKCPRQYSASLSFKARSLIELKFQKGIIPK